MFLKLSHTKLKVWQNAIALSELIFRVTATFPKREHYGLAGHLRKTATSVASNIAEGASRSSSKERRRFYEIARSSLVELDTQLEIAVRSKCIDRGDLVDLKHCIPLQFVMLSNLIKATNRSRTS